MREPRKYIVSIDPKTKYGIGFKDKLDIADGSLWRVWTDWNSETQQWEIALIEASNV